MMGLAQRTALRMRDDMIVEAKGLLDPDDPVLNYEYVRGMVELIVRCTFLETLDGNTDVLRDKVWQQVTGQPERDTSIPAKGIPHIVWDTEMHEYGLDDCNFWDMTPDTNCGGRVGGLIVVNENDEGSLRYVLCENHYNKEVVR